MEETTILQQFRDYYNSKPDISQETMFLERFATLSNQYHSCTGVESYRTIRLQDTKQELHRAVSKFSKHFSKTLSRSSVLPERLEKYNKDYTFDIKLRDIHNTKVDRQKLKSQSVQGLPKYKDLNTRLVLYSNLVNAALSLDTIVTEEDAQDGNALGSTLSGIISTARTTGFKYARGDESRISEFNTYIDIAPGFDLEASHTLGDPEHNYSTNDIFRITNTMNKLKKSISGAYVQLQDKLKTQPDNHGSQSTITGLLYYRGDSSSRDVVLRLYRIATLCSLFEACCGYAYDLDYQLTCELLQTLERSYKTEE